MAKKKTINADPNLTLEQLSRAYLDHIEKDGKSVGTCFSYLMELKTAMGELGAETLVASLTAEDIDRFNKCKRVTKLAKSGKPKSQLSIDKTRRVLRLALAWAAQSGLIASSPIPAKGEATSAEVEAAAPAKKPRKARVVADEPAPDAEVAPPTDDSAPALTETAA